jgi:hypothetical protein
MQILLSPYRFDIINTSINVLKQERNANLRPMFSICLPVYKQADHFMSTLEAG